MANFGSQVRYCVVCGKKFKTSLKDIKRKRGPRKTCRPRPSQLPGTSCRYILWMQTQKKKPKPFSLRKIKMLTPGYAMIADPDEHIPPIIPD